MKQATRSAFVATIIATTAYAALRYFSDSGNTLTETAIFAVTFFGVMTIVSYFLRSRV